MEYKGYIGRLEALHQAIKRRSDYINRPTYIKGDIRIPIKDIEGGEFEQENELCNLFREYILAVERKAYVRSYVNLPRDNLCLRGIRAMFQWLKENPEHRPCSALIIWALFTTETKKLATGELFCFRFYMKTRRTPDKEPETMQETLSRKIDCNVLLFDHLLDILPPEDGDREFAKFQFYAFTRYDRFTHYKTNTDKLYDFDTCQRDLTDGVDQLGVLIRYLIDHCLMNTVAWLNIEPGHDRCEALNSLATLLLHDATLMPTDRRLTDRIRRVLEEPKECKSIMSVYMNMFNVVGESSEAAKGGSFKVAKVLRAFIAKHNLHFREAHAFIDADEMKDPHLEQCEQFILEHALKERIFKKYFGVLYQKAKELFDPKLFLSETVFDT